MKKTKFQHPDIDSNFIDFMLNQVKKSCPSSEFNLHREGRLEIPSHLNDSPPNVLRLCESDIEKILKHAAGSPAMIEVGNIRVGALMECCRLTYEKIFNRTEDAIFLCEESKKNRNVWQQLRQFRITGSRCYALYTALKNPRTDWKEKATRYYWPKKFSNVFVKHGELY